jgi:hypothetical protein
MKKSIGQLAVTPYELIAQTSRDREVINPSVNNPLAPENEMNNIHFQEQPEQQAQAHEESEGKRRALELIEEYASDISEDDYEFNDDISIQQQPRQSAQANSEPWEQKQGEQQGDEDEEDDLIIHPQPGSDEAREQHQPQQQAQGLPGKDEIKANWQ